jgi:plasmid stabilization system protein ParE
MRPRFVVRRRAALEAREAFRWYEEQRSGLGDRFRTDLKSVLGRIVENPAQFPVIEASVRFALLHTFPYKIYFDLRSDRVVILAVFHQSRHPDIWKRRE